MARAVEIQCAHCRRPFEVDASTRACPHCGATRAGRCRECGTAIYLGATTCAAHSQAGGVTAPTGPPPSSPPTGPTGPGWAPSGRSAAPGGRTGPGEGWAPRPPTRDVPPVAPGGSGPWNPWTPAHGAPAAEHIGGGWGAERAVDRPPTRPTPVGAGTVSPAPSFGDVLPTGGRRRRPRPRLAVVVAAAVVLGAAGAVATLWPRPDHPKAWDPRITDLVAFVENERGLRFEHPVYVNFLPDAEFRELVTSPGNADAAADAQMESYEAMLRAVGFITGDVDLASIGDELHGDGTVGLYAFEDEQIYVRGESLDNERRATLVHELTHALQDQYFDIGKMEHATSGASTAFTAVVEADAEKVEAAWMESLPAADREALAAAERKASESMDFAGVPEVFLEMTAFPYVLGPGFVDAVVAVRGEAGRDELLRRPPTTEEHIIRPDTYLAHQAPRRVPTPRLAAGERAIEHSESDFGMLSLLILLGERLDFSVAWPAVQGWAGDSSIGFERDGTTCMRISVHFDEAPQAARFGDAFARWGEGIQTVRLEVDDRAVLAESCDPGPGRVAARADGHLSGIQGFGFREGIVFSMTDGGLPEATATCMADGLLARVGTDRLAALDAEVGENPDGRAGRELARLSEEVAGTCPA